MSQLEEEHQGTTKKRHLTVRIDNDKQWRKLAVFAAKMTTKLQKSVSFNLAMTMLIDMLPDEDDESPSESMPLKKAQKR